MDLIERVESYKVLFKECKALEPVSTALAKGYKSATPLQRLEIIRELDTELAEVYSVEIPVITAWVRDDNYVHSTKEIFLGEPSLEGFLHQFRHHLQNKAREPQYKYLLQKMWEHGAQGEYFSFVNANIKRMINNLAKAGNNVRFLGDNGSMQNVLGIGVQKIVTDFGEISLVLDRYADTKTILTVDLGEVQIAELRGTFYEDLPKAGDYFKGHVLNESTIKLLNSHAGSKISITEASL